MSEACSQVATRAPGPPAPGSDVGRPLAGVEVRLSDGEIQVRGPMLMTRYLPPAESPFLDGGWFPTGDMGEIDAEGRLHVTGRRTDRIITGGENVDPLEVERALSMCAGVSAACVFGIADERWGETVNAAIIASAPSSPPSLEAVASHVAASLATFKRPRAIAIVEAFSQNGTGKVDRRATARAVATALTPLPRVG
jgi:O-succinylbenzoic acid--CoA ligase